MLCRCVLALFVCRSRNRVGVALTERRQPRVRRTLARAQAELRAVWFGDVPAALTLRDLQHCWFRWLTPALVRAPLPALRGALETLQWHAAEVFWDCALLSLVVAAMLRLNAGALVHVAVVVGACHRGA
jgi:hypothetical protein